MIKKNNTTYKLLNHMTTLFLFVFFSAFSVAFAGDDAKALDQLTPKEFVIRYWDKHISNNLPKPSFLLSMASPLSAIDTVKFTKLAATNALPTRLPEFCSAAHLLCFPNVMPRSRPMPRTQEGDDSFPSYAKNSRGSSKWISAITESPPSVTFKDDYKKKADLGHKVGFKKYGVSLVNKWVEPGKFFSERMLKQGTVMPMPDIRDKLPKRSFLPRSILSKIPFTSSKISELKRIFNVSNNSSMHKVMMDSLSECERAPSMGETKQCVGSLEDMIDFATLVLDRNITVRTTENVNGSRKNMTLGKVKGINGGKITKSVSCHQSLFPYLLYYCHSVSNVRLYEADLLDPNSNAKINHGVAICHLDTTSWSPTHSAFLPIGSGPGQIEVCHWIFENDLTWTIAD